MKRQELVLKGRGVGGQGRGRCRVGESGESQNVGTFETRAWGAVATAEVEAEAGRGEVGAI